MTDLRAGAAVVLAALVAKGKPAFGLKHLKRGYFELVEITKVRSAHFNEANITFF